VKPTGQPPSRGPDLKSNNKRSQQKKPAVSGTPAGVNAAWQAAEQQKEEPSYRSVRGTSGEVKDSPGITGGLLKRTRRRIPR